MRKNRFYLEDLKQESPLLIIDKDIINQLRSVLRSKPGDIVYLFNGQGLELESEIVALTSQQVELKILNKEEKLSNHLPTVNLYLAILKKENFELAVQKAVEVGVTNIFPLLTDRTVKLGLKEERLRLIIKEACEQSGRSIIPDLKKALTFDEALSWLGDNESNLFFDLPEFSKNRNNLNLEEDQSLNLFIGPEGGWSDREREMAKQKQFSFCELGPYVLRAETAAIVATWLAINKKL